MLVDCFNNPCILQITGNEQPKATAKMQLPLNLAILADKIGGNDPQVQMTMALWMHKAIHIATWIIG